jgi:hypothetical protein
MMTQDQCNNVDTCNNNDTIAKTPEQWNDKKCKTDATTAMHATTQYNKINTRATDQQERNTNAMAKTYASKTI